MCVLFCYYLFLISPSFGTSGKLCFVIMGFPVYLHLFVVVFTFVTESIKETIK